MADKLLKSLTFPDLADRYVIPTDAEDFTYEGENLKEVLDNKANTDGYYQNMSVGDADQLISTIRENDKTPYVFRTSGGSVDIGDREYVNGIVGGTVAWNQLYNPTDIISNTISGVTFTVNADGSILANGTATATIRKAVLAISFGVHSLVGHKMLFWSCPSGGSASTYKMSVSYIGEGTRDTGSGAIWSIPDTEYSGPLAINIAEGTVCDNLVFRPQCINLTKLFGSTIADYIYSLETATAGAGVAWFKKLFPKPYYEYNAGELKSVSGLVSHDMTGFNQWDEEWRNGLYGNDGAFVSNTNYVANKNAIEILPSTTYYFHISPTMNAGRDLFFYDDGGNFISKASYYSNSVFTTPSNAHYMNFNLGAAYGATYKNDICINISWDGSRNGEYEPYVKHSYPLDSDLTLRGIPKLDANNALHYDGDVYEADGTVNRKYGIVDLGTLTWAMPSGATDIFYTDLSGKKVSDNIICSKYVNNGTYGTYNSYFFDKDKIIMSSDYTYRIGIKDSAYSDATAFKTAMNGVHVVYELATPTEETADPYNGVQIVDDFGTEEYVLNGFAVPVGHDTDYPVNLKAKLEMAPDSPSGDGDYIVRQTNGTNAYVPLVIEDALPTIPSTAGSYVLTVTVTDGSDPTLEWVAQS